MADIPAYTLAELLTEQVVIERDVTTPDQWGADDAPSFQPYLTVACRLYWAKSTGTRSSNRTYTNVTREVSVTDGGLVLPLGTDVTEADRIAQINEWDPISGEWVLKVEGPMEITATVNEHTHLELSIQRTQLGA